ncbi:TetR family transcriptional regulator [Amycolatopsis sp. NPDC051373]|uniref:TetR/AcrR family transcriptional regulator n=1 Tax=Amycolatopsis sp. NPDC051373 TaxID=3155801 RepID=UPI00344B85F6
MPDSSSPRRRDAAASRDRLLAAAGELFAERGYDQTTARDIGERAGVDPTMIARYFGGKAQLFIAVLRAESEPGERLPDVLEPVRLRGLIERTGTRGPGPILQAAIRPYDNPEAQEAALAELDHRVLTPLRERFVCEGVANPELRAEVLSAALIGVILGRHAGTLEHLADAGTDEVLTLLQEILGTE